MGFNGYEKRVLMGLAAFLLHDGRHNGYSFCGIEGLEKRQGNGNEALSRAWA
jgi:hypothetical protein